MAMRFIQSDSASATGALAGTLSNMWPSTVLLHGPLETFGYVKQPTKEPIGTFEASWNINRKIYNPDKYYHKGTNLHSREIDSGNKQDLAIFLAQ